MSSEFRKSTYSSSSGGNCVEVGTAQAVLVRDTQDRGGATISVPAASWTRFLATLR